MRTYLNYAQLGLTLRILDLVSKADYSPLLKGSELQIGRSAQLDKFGVDIRHAMGSIVGTSDLAPLDLNVELCHHIALVADTLVQMCKFYEISANTADSLACKLIEDQSEHLIDQGIY